MRLIVALSAAALAAAPALADHGKVDHAKMDHSKMDHSKMTPADHARMMQPSAANPYAPSEMKMHHAMMKATGADASETWVRKMIEHHRGAMEMSKVAMAQAKDKQARDMAQKTSAMQVKEIAEMQGWLKRHGKRPQ